MKLEEISAIILTRPEVAAWPDLSNILTKAVSGPRQDWELPLLASRAVGGNDDLVTLAAAALVCVQISVTLVDDILDQDPRGAHLKLAMAKQPTSRWHYKPLLFVWSKKFQSVQKRAQQ